MAHGTEEEQPEDQVSAEQEEDDSEADAEGESEDDSEADAEGEDLGVTAGEIDEAIAYVREGVQDGVGSQTVLKGDF